jgi:hypothetical protein
VEEVRHEARKDVAPLIVARRQNIDHLRSEIKGSLMFGL